MKQAVQTTAAPSPGGPYSQAIVVDDWIFVAGQVPRDPETNQIPDGIEAQTHKVFANIRAILESAGANLDDVVRVTAYLVDLNDFDAYNAAYVQHFHEPYPARTTIGAQLKGVRIEIDVIARRESSAV